MAPASEGIVQSRATRLIVLDRDGVINHDSPEFIKSPDEWRPIPGSLEAIARLNHAGYRVVVATNQSGVGRGLLDFSTLAAIHDGMHREIGVRFSVDLAGVACVGDGLRDLQAAETVGAQPMLVLTGKGEKTLRDGGFPKNTVVFPDLAFVASALLAAD